MNALIRNVSWTALASAMLWANVTHAALIDVTQPGDLITIVNGLNDGDALFGPPPAAETVEHAIDNVGQKYLNFLDLGSGFIVTPTLGAGSGGTIVEALRLYTANDFVNRDPASYLLEGSANGGPFTVISSGPLALPAGRNPGGSTPLGAFFQEVSFANTIAYHSYRLTFPTLKNAALVGSMQIGEVEFLGSVVPSAPEPATVGLFALGLVGLLARGRQR